MANRTFKQSANGQVLTIKTEFYVGIKALAYAFCEVAKNGTSAKKVDDPNAPIQIETRSAKGLPKVTVKQCLVFLEKTLKDKGYDYLKTVQLSLSDEHIEALTALFPELTEEIEALTVI